MSKQQGLASIKRPAVIVPLLIICMVMVFVGVAIGAVKLSLQQLIAILNSVLLGDEGHQALTTWTSAQADILTKVRLPRVIMGALVGMSLSVAGATYQGLFRNPMAGPYMIGVASGSGFGAVIGIYFRWQFTWLGLNAVPLAAFAGGLITMFIVYRVSTIGGRIPMTTLLLAGIAIGSVFSAGISTMIFFSDQMVGTIVFWLMGSLNSATWTKVQAIVPYVLIGLVIVFSLARPLNAMLLGEESAAYLGIDTERIKRILLFASTLLVAAAVSASGIIGFVGLIVPHVVRLFTGPDHRILLPASALLGAAFMVGVDLAARTLIAPSQLPVGILTAFAGGPFFVYLLRKRAKGDVV